MSNTKFVNPPEFAEFAERFRVMSNTKFVHDPTRNSTRVRIVNPPEFAERFRGRRGTIDHERSNGAYNLHFVHVVIDDDPDTRPYGFHVDQIEIIEPASTTSAQ